MPKKKEVKNDYWKKKAKAILNLLQDELRWLEGDMASIYSNAMQGSGCKEQVYDKLNVQFCWRKIGERKKLKETIDKFASAGIY